MRSFAMEELAIDNEHRERQIFSQKRLPGLFAFGVVVDTPPELVMARLNIDRATLDAIPREELVLVPR